MFVPVDRTLVPDGLPIQQLAGNVFSQATKPTMDQIAQAVEVAQRAEAMNTVPTCPLDQTYSAASLEQTPSDSRNDQLPALQVELRWMRTALKSKTLCAG